jgi:signal transduction histidine kinase
VVVHIGASKSEVFISVKDKGIGVPQEMERSLFAWGTRGADPRVKHQQGLGIGLYMADTYARWMRGRIEYKRRKEETRFVVILPISLEEADEEVSQEKQL